jgi:hypothetical protein
VDPVTPEPPISAQVGEEKVPDAIQEPEEPDPDATEGRPDDKDTTAEPSA